MWNPRVFWSVDRDVHVAFALVSFIDWFITSQFPIRNRWISQISMTCSHSCPIVITAGQPVRRAEVISWPWLQPRWPAADPRCFEETSLARRLVQAWSQLLRRSVVGGQRRDCGVKFSWVFDCYFSKCSPLLVESHDRPTGQSCLCCFMCSWIMTFCALKKEL